MLALTYAIFSDALAPYLPSLPLTFAVLPFVIWTALRFGQREVAALNALVCIIAVWHTIAGHGPFASAPFSTSLLLLLAFMGTVFPRDSCSTPSSASAAAPPRRSRRP